MSKRNDDFFKEKKPWSFVKDELLGCYLKPYITKILHTHKPLVYVDCFAGKGKFEDGNPGSPLIALDIISQCLENTAITLPFISANFIDLNYADDLRQNLTKYEGINIVSGQYEDNVEELLKNKSGCNVFIYIDPYGIKALKFSLFDSFADKSFNSIELLINMNSFGFIREGCHALGAIYEDDSVFDDLIEYDSTKYNSSEKSVKELNDIAGGDYWQNIIEDLKIKIIDGYQAEKMFAEKYCSRLKQSYKYVLNMPLRIRMGQRPKYRLIHCTNHRDGCLLMVDNIWNRWQVLQNLQNNGQLLLWTENCENRIVDEKDVERRIVEQFSEIVTWKSLHDALAEFFMNHGPICSTSKVKDIIKKLNNEKRIEIKRTPSKTLYNKDTTFMSERKDQTVCIRWKNEKNE